MASPAAGLVTGDMIVKVAAKHVGEAYVLGAQVPKDNPNWTGPWDCAEFASWALYQVTQQLYGCKNDHGNPATADAYTGYWKQDAESIGDIVTLEEAARTPGAFVLRVPQPGATGHIVISDGKGGTVEAHSSADGVIQGKLAKRRWDMGILAPGIDYRQRASVKVAPAGPIYRVANPLMAGAAVIRIQKALAAKGIDPGTVDGVYGPHTGAAVRAFQMTNGLTPDGEVGPATAKALGIVARG
jgi:murein L,D-transpeptidase YcbB/YkuD